MKNLATTIVCLIALIPASARANFYGCQLGSCFETTSSGTRVGIVNPEYCLPAHCDAPSRTENSASSERLDEEQAAIDRAEGQAWLIRDRERVINDHVSRAMKAAKQHGAAVYTPLFDKTYNDVGAPVFLVSKTEVCEFQEGISYAQDGRQFEAPESDSVACYPLGAKAIPKSIQATQEAIAAAKKERESTEMKAMVAALVKRAFAASVKQGLHDKFKAVYDTDPKNLAKPIFLVSDTKSCKFVEGIEVSDYGRQFEAPEQDFVDCKPRRTPVTERAEAVENSPTIQTDREAEPAKRNGDGSGLQHSTDYTSGTLGE